MLLLQKYKLGLFWPEKHPSNLHLEMESVWEELKKKNKQPKNSNQKTPNQTKSTFSSKGMLEIFTQKRAL